MHVVKLGRNLLKENAAKQSHESFDLCVAEAVELPCAENSIEIAVTPRIKLNAIAGKNLQHVHSLLTGQKLIESKNAFRRKSKGVVQQCRTHVQRRIIAHAGYLWFAYPVPILQRGFNISLKKVNCGQKVIRIRIFRIEAKRTVQVVRGLTEMTLFKSHSCQLDRKSFIAWDQFGACLQSIFGFLPTLQMAKGYAVVII